MRGCRHYLFWAGYTVASVVCQLMLGDFPFRFFEFPVNAAVMLLWLVMLWILFKEKRNSSMMSLLQSRETTMSLIGLFVMACLVQGFSTEKLTTAWWFVAVLFALESHLFIVLLRGMSVPRSNRLRFVLTHAGVLVAIAGGMFGSPDTKDWRIAAFPGQQVNRAVDVAGNERTLGYYFELVDWNIESYDNGVPKKYEATVVVNGRGKAVLKVNHPYRLSLTDDLYLSAVASDGCVLQVVRHPWKYLEFAGIIMLLAGAVLLFLNGPGYKDGRTG